jgi:ATP-dependent protease Clp ATPase subunit
VANSKKSAPIYTIQCCAFCGLTQYQVEILVQGPAIGFKSMIHICSDCVDVCAGIVQRHREARKEPQAGLDGAEEHAVTTAASEA